MTDFISDDDMQNLDQAPVAPVAPDFIPDDQMPDFISDDEMISVDPSIPENPNPVQPGQMLQRQPSVGSQFQDSLRDVSAPAMAGGLLELTERPPQAVGAFFSEMEDLKDEDLTPREKIEKAAEVAWAKLNGQKVPALTFGQLLEQQMLKQGANPIAAGGAGQIGDFSMSAVVDPLNGIGPVYRALVKGGAAAPKFLDDTIDVLSRLRRTKKIPDVLPTGETVPVDPVGYGRQTKAPGMFMKFAGTLGGVKPEYLAFQLQHGAAAKDARNLKVIGDDVNQLFHAMAKGSDDTKRELDFARGAAKYAKERLTKDLEYQASPKTVSGTISTAVTDLKNKVKGLSSAGFDALEESDKILPMDDFIMAVNNFKNEVMGSPTGILGADPTPIVGYQSKILSDSQMLIEGVFNRYGPDGIPLSELKRILKDELPFDHYGKVQGDYNFPDAVAKAWRSSFHGTLNGKLKEIAPPEYSSLMKEAHEIASFMEDNAHIIADGKANTYLGSVKSFLRSTGQLPEGYGAYHRLAELTGRDDIPKILSGFEDANRNLSDSTRLQSLLNQLPEVQSEQLYRDAIQKYADWQMEFPLIKGGATPGETFVTRMSRIKNLEEMTEVEKKTLAALNEVMTEQNGVPTNIMQEIVDRKIMDAVGPDAYAQGQATSRTLIGTLAGAATYGVGVDLSTALIAAYIGGNVGRMGDRYGPVVTKKIVNTVYGAAGGAIKVGKSAGSAGVKMIDILGNLDKTLHNRALWGTVNELVNPNSSLHRQGQITVDDPETLSFLRTEIMKTKGMKNREKAKLINDINSGALTFTIDGPSPFESLAPSDGTEPRRAGVSPDVLELLKKSFEGSGIEKKKNDGASVDPGRLMRDDEMLGSGLEQEIPGRNKGMNLLRQALGSVFGDSLDTSMDVADMLVPESYGDFAPGMAALPPWVKRADGTIDMALVKKLKDNPNFKGGEIEIGEIELDPVMQKHFEEYSKIRQAEESMTPSEKMADLVRIQEDRAKWAKVKDQLSKPYSPPKEVSAEQQKKNLVNFQKRLETENKPDLKGINVHPSMNEGLQSKLRTKLEEKKRQREIFSQYFSNPQLKDAVSSGTYFIKEAEKADMIPDLIKHLGPTAESSILSGIVQDFAAIRSTMSGESLRYKTWDAALKKKKDLQDLVNRIEPFIKDKNRLADIKQFWFERID